MEQMELTDLMNRVAAIKAGADEDGVITGEPTSKPKREPFGEWLRAQKGRGDWIDYLADDARRDPRFPRRGSPDEIRAHLEKVGAEAETLAALDSAELDWASL